MDTKHTPGPWKFNDVIGGCSIHAGSRQLLRYSFSPDAENKSNARLMAAAPELLEALEIMIIGACAVGVPHQGERKVLQDAVDHARATIAKATGKEA